MVIKWGGTQTDRTEQSTHSLEMIAGKARHSVRGDQLQRWCWWLLVIGGGDRCRYGPGTHTELNSELNWTEQKKQKIKSALSAVAASAENRRCHYL